MGATRTNQQHEVRCSILFDGTTGTVTSRCTQSIEMQLGITTTRINIVKHYLAISLAEKRVAEQP
jgi:hypothetical protein